MVQTIIVIFLRTKYGGEDTSLESEISSSGGSDGKQCCLPTRRVDSIPKGKGTDKGKGNGKNHSEDSLDQTDTETMKKEPFRRKCPIDCVVRYVDNIFLGLNLLVTACLLLTVLGRMLKDAEEFQKTLSDHNITV